MGNILRQIHYTFRHSNCNRSYDDFTFNPLQRAIIPIAISTALGDMPQLVLAIEQGLDQQLPISTAKEVMVHLHAYVGFPRNVNALNTLLTVVKRRRDQGIQDCEDDSEPTETINPDSLRIGTAN